MRPRGESLHPPCVCRLDTQTGRSHSARRRGSCPLRPAADRHARSASCSYARTCRARVSPPDRTCSSIPASSEARHRVRGNRQSVRAARPAAIGTITLPRTAPARCVHSAALRTARTSSMGCSWRRRAQCRCPRAARRCALAKQACTRSARRSMTHGFRWQRSETRREDRVRCAVVQLASTQCSAARSASVLSFIAPRCYLQLVLGSCDHSFVALHANVTASSAAHLGATSSSASRLECGRPAGVRQLDQLDRLRAHLVGIVELRQRAQPQVAAGDDAERAAAAHQQARADRSPPRFSRPSRRGSMCGHHR